VQRGEAAGAVERDQPARAPRRRSSSASARAPPRPRREAREHSLGDVARQQQARDRLAQARARHRGARVVRVRAAAWSESPTRPTRLFVVPPVEVAAARWPCVERPRPRVPVEARARRRSSACDGRREAALARECRRSLAGEQDVLALVEQRARDPDRIRERRQRDHAAVAQRRTVHQRGVELDLARAVGCRARARVEARIVLERRDRGDHGVERAPARAQHLGAGLRRGAAAREGALAVVAGAQLSRTAVDENAGHTRHGGTLIG
jgi:hypothetical protein